MKRDHGRLKAAPEQKRLEQKPWEQAHYRTIYEHSRRTPPRLWSILYLSTTLAAVVVVSALMIFGVGANNRPISESLSLRSFANTAANFFAKLDFPLSTSSNSHSNSSISSPSTSQNKGDQSQNKNDSESIEVSTSPKGLYDFDYSLVPDGYTPILPLDLSLTEYGEYYINNSTGYFPDIKALLNKSLKNNGVELLSKTSKPQVLIVHTHGTEAYSENGALYCDDSISDYARTSDTTKNVVSIGQTVADILNQSGVSTIHCTVLHDSLQYKDSYARAEQTIKAYLEEYPSIKLVIDIHRDSIVKSNGELVRPVAELNGEAAAQLMCVVGSDWAGDACPNWENNLSLALKLRGLLNDECENICRPVFLKGNTYNQELAPFSLLIEVGASGNSIEEARRSAALLAQSIAKLISQI